MIAATLATLKTGHVKSQISGDQIRSPSIRNAADMMNVSKTLVIEAKYVLKEGIPEEIDDAEQGNKRWAK